MVYKSFPVSNSLKIDKLFCLFKLNCRSGYTFNGELHNFWECVYVIDGNICVSSDENVYNLSKGDIVFHKPQEFHKFHIEEGNEATLFDFSFSFEGNLAEKISGLVCSLNEKQIQIMNMFIDFYNDECDKNPKSKNSIYTYNVLPVFKNDEIYLQTVRMYILQLILSLSNDSITLKTLENSETKLLKSAIEIMDSNVESELLISNLAKSLNISLSSLKRLFKKYTGMSVYKFYLTIKIRTATTLLQNGMSVSEVSNQLGFSSPAYFSAAYKREVGCRPSDDIPKN